MNTYKVTAKHQVEKDGRMYHPGQIVPGVNPEKDQDDRVRVDHGLLEKVEKKNTSVSKVENTEVPEQAEDKTPAQKGKGTDSKQTTGNAKGSSSDKKETSS